VILMDTDICIELLRGNRLILEKRRTCFDEVAVAFMTAAELFYGAEKSKKRIENLSLVERFLLSVRVMHTDSDVALKFGQLKARLTQDGLMLPDADLLIAATAIGRDAILITGNVKHFQRISELKIDNWLK
jgi:tRNA(fMet)-specific endonuclease VapC